jgi:acyl dehydratase
MSVRSFEDVSVGETFGPEVVAVGRDTLVAYAKGVGLPDVIAHGMWTMGASSSVVARWVGDAGRVLEFGTRFTKPVVVPTAGNEISVTGVVKSVNAEQRRATVDVTTTCGDDKVLGRCIAVVQLA